MVVEDEEADSGSSTESEYYEDVDYRALVLPPPPATQPTVAQTQDIVALDRSTRANAIGPAVGSATIASRPDDSPQPLEASQVITEQRSTLDAISTSPRWLLPERTGTETPFDSDTFSGNTETAASARSSTCSHCRASTSVVLRPTAFQRVHRLCHCCKSAIGHVRRDIIHTDYAMVHLHFCFSCFERNGREFMAQVRTLKPAAVVKCSGCCLVKPRHGFHKRQQILRPWEELLGQKHFCLVCLPSGFERDEDAIVPRKMKCVKCHKEKDRNSFIRSLKEQALSCNGLSQFRQWVKEGLFICECCTLCAAHAAQRLPCSQCNRLLSRTQKYSANQRAIARNENANPGHLGRKPDYICLDCKPEEGMLKFKGVEFLKDDMTSERTDQSPRTLRDTSKVETHVILSNQ